MSHSEEQDVFVAETEKSSIIFRHDGPHKIAHGYASYYSYLCELRRLTVGALLEKAIFLSVESIP